MAIQDLKRKIGALPDQPGVYIYLNAGGETIYVGKARSLRDRVRSYLGAYGINPKTDALLDEAADLDIIVTDSDVEALALEDSLIKRRHPRFNVLLRDDKNYPYLKLTLDEPAPRVLIARQVERDGAFYAGPFMPTNWARRMMGLTHRIFGIRSCNEVITGKRPRPCLEYDIKRCLAPCVDAICPADEYRAAAEDTRLFLEGRNDELLEGLRRKMEEASAAERFELAAHYRDAIHTIARLDQRQQKVATPQLGDRDVVAYVAGGRGALVHVLVMRAGRVIERLEFAMEPPRAEAAGREGSGGPPGTPPLAFEGRRSAAGGAEPGGSPEPQTAGLVGSEGEFLRTALLQMYDGSRTIPPEIHVPIDFEDRDAVERLLGQRAGHRVAIRIPKRGDKRGLIDLALRNVVLAYEAHATGQHDTQMAALEALRDALGLEALPRRIEAFDISHIQGSDIVASMVVCEEGRMRRGDYRKYRIRTVRGASDDCQSMAEVVSRRYRRALDEGGPFPELIVIDGGKGQLSAAYGALDELGLARIPAVAIAKREEELFVRGQPDPIVLPGSSPALRLLQRIRDEAHRFAVSFHRRARAMRDLRSVLDDVPGIGAVRRRRLLETFGSLEGVRAATREQLAAVVGARTAEAVLAHFEKRGGESF